MNQKVRQLFLVACVLATLCMRQDEIWGADVADAGDFLLDWNPVRELPLLPLQEMLTFADRAISESDQSNRHRLSRLFYIKAQLLRHSDKRAESLIALQESLRLDPVNISSRYLTLYSRMAPQGADEKTLAEIRDFASRFPGRSEPLLLLGQDAYIKDDHEVAFNNLRRVVEIDPECIRARVLLASIHASRWDVQRATDEARIVLASGRTLDEDHFDAHGIVGDCYVKMGMAEQAIPHLMTYWRYEHATRSGNLIVLSGLMQSGRFALARNVVTELRARDQSDWRVDCDDAILVAAGGDVSGAVKMLDALVATDSERAKAWLFRGRIHQEEEEWSNAFACFERASNLDDMTAPDAALRAKLMLAGWPEGVNRPPLSVDLEAALRKARGMFVTADGKLAKAIHETWMGSRPAGLFELRRLSGDKNVAEAIRESARHLLNLAESGGKYDISRPPEGMTWSPPLVTAMVGPYN